MAYKDWGYFLLNILTLLCLFTDLDLGQTRTQGRTKEHCHHAYSFIFLSQYMCQHGIFRRFFFSSILPPVPSSKDIVFLLPQLDGAESTPVLF